MSSIVIVDYGMGNIRSIFNKFRKMGVIPEVSSDVEVIDKADKLILPGVGHFGTAMKILKDRNLFDILNKKVLTDKIPILGICLGMQLFTNHSEEGDCKGFGWIDAETIKFKFDDYKIKIPHMGWNSIKIEKDSCLMEEIPQDELFYFVHSYYVRSNNKADVLTSTRYGIEFTSGVEKDNIFGTQFHPEKSHDYGFRILENFVKL